MKSNLPKAVQKQSDRADELIALAKKEDGKTGETVSEPNLDAFTGDKGEERKADERQAPEKPDDPLPDFKHKYEVLQAKYNAEVPALHQQVKSLERQMAELKDVNSSLKSEVDALKQMEDSGRCIDGDDDLNSLADDDPDLAAIFRRQQKELERALDEIKTLKQEQSKIDERFSTAEERSLEHSQAVFYEDVAKAVPDWEKVNVDQGFIDWLAVRVPGTVYTRHQLLEEAHDALDAARVIELFNGYLEQKKSESTGRSEEDLIDPDASGGGVGGEAEKPIYSRAWVKSFYADASKGKSKYTDEQWTQIDRDIQAAQVDGRIRG